MSTAVVVASVFCAGLCGALGLPSVLDYVEQTRNRVKLKGRLSHKAKSTDDNRGKRGSNVGFAQALMQSGIVPLRPLSGLLLKSRLMQNKAAKYVKAMSIKGHQSNPTAVMELQLVFAIALFILIYLLTGVIVAAGFAVVTVVLVINSRVQKTMANWELLLIEQIPDALRALGICFAAGFSLQQAFEQVSKETQAPLGEELKQTSYDISAGRSVKEALLDLESRIKVEDLRFAVIALEIQQKTGGSLQELLENAADAVVASNDLRRQLAVQTSQARMSAKVVTILPLLLVGALSLAMEGYLATFFSSIEGLSILLLAAAMELAGILLIRKILGLNLG